MTSLVIKVDFTSICVNRRHKLHEMLARFCLVLPKRFDDCKVSVLVVEPAVRMDRKIGSKALVIPAYWDRDSFSHNAVRMIERDRFDITQFARVFSAQRTSLVFKHFTLESQTESSHSGMEGLAFLFTNCVSVRIIKQEWSKRLNEDFVLRKKCQIKHLVSQQCRYSCPDFDH